MSIQVTTIRLPKEQAEKVREMANKFGVTDSVILRWAVEALLEYAELHGGTMHLPLDLSAEWKNVTDRAASALAALENDPANHHFTAQTLADQAAMEADIAAKRKSPERR